MVNPSPMAAALVLLAVTAQGSTLLVEAEWMRPTQEDKAGKGPAARDTEKRRWVVDGTFVDQVGSSFLMAQGFGQPVGDVVARFTASEAGKYRVLARTRDWWAPHGAGKFQVSVDGTELVETFGTKGDGKWIWQEGGEVTLSAGEHAVAVHDLTGLHARVDCILFTTDANLRPPDGGAKSQRAFRRPLLGQPASPPEAGPFDLVVVGGGRAGMGAALAAGRLGLKVALVQNMPELGGNPVPFAGAPKGEHRYPAILELAREAVQHKTSLPPLKHVQIFTNWHVYDLRMEGKRIVAAVAVHAVDGRERSFSAPYFVDCTGDGNVGFLAGATFLYGDDGREVHGEPGAPEKNTREVMGSNLHFTVRPVPPGAPFQPLPDFLTWDRYGAAFWKDAKHISAALATGWNAESGYFLDRPTEDERVRDLMMQRVYCALSYRQNHSDEPAERSQLVGMELAMCKRESRRLVGDVVMREQDMWVDKDKRPAPEARAFDDGVALSGWGVDVHTSQKALGQAQGLPQELWFMCGRVRGASRACGPVYVPYRSLYARDVENLFMAGRCVSVSRIVLGVVRVTQTTAQMGVAVGRSAAVCRKHGAPPRTAYEKHLDELKRSWALPATANSID